MRSSSGLTIFSFGLSQMSGNWFPLSMLTDGQHRRHDDFGVFVSFCKGRRRHPIISSRAESSRNRTMGCNTREKVENSKRLGGAEFRICVGFWTVLKFGSYVLQPLAISLSLSLSHTHTHTHNRVCFRFRIPCRKIPF
jgi:hypothetical protein